MPTKKTTTRKTTTTATRKKVIRPASSNTVLFPEASPTPTLETSISIGDMLNQNQEHEKERTKIYQEATAKVVKQQEDFRSTCLALAAATWLLIVIGTFLTAGEPDLWDIVVAQASRAAFSGGF